MSEQSIYPHQWDNEAPIVEDKGILWVSHDDLIRMHYSGLEAGVVVFINGEFFELVGYSPTRHSWWIRFIDVDHEFDDLPLYGEEASS